MTERRTDLDALRGFAMLLGIAIHASLSFFPVPWPVHDTQHSRVLPLLFLAVHGFRMPLDTALKGYAHRTILPEPAIAEILSGDRGGSIRCRRQ